MTKTPISEVEQIAGKRADFRVYYRRSGKLYFDAMWGETEAVVRRKFLAFAKELRWKVEITKVVPIQADA